jgi:large subunit ribosomal protein L5
MNSIDPIQVITISNNSRFQTYYNRVVAQDMLLKQNYNTIFELPNLKKITLHTSSKQYLTDKKQIIPALLGLKLITGQKATLTYAKKAIATFKLRKNQILGCKVSLRKQSLYFFLDRLVTIVLPRLRDFSGLNTKSITKTGNFSIGLDNLLIFPELENHYEFFESLRGININFSVSAKSPKDVSLLYSAFQLPNIIAIRREM